jgi:hypothetical protein
MPETTTTRTVKNQNVGDTVVQQEQLKTAETVDPQEFKLFKSAQVLWYLSHFIAIILILRFVFLLLGANLTGIVRMIYDFSSIFVIPFRGIFPSPTSGEFYFDTAALLGIAMYYLLVLIIVKALELFSKDTSTDLS